MLRHGICPATRVATRRCLTTQGARRAPGVVTVVSSFALLGGGGAIIAGGGLAAWALTEEVEAYDPRQHGGGDDEERRRRMEERRREREAAEMARSKGSFISGIVGTGALLGVAFTGWMITRYRRCPANQLLIISGKTFGSAGSSSKQLHGGGTFVWPVIQEYTYLSLEPIPLEIPLRGALSLEKIRVNVPSVFTVAVGTDPALTEAAARRLLGLEDQISHFAEEIVLGQLRQVIASLTIDEINRDRERFTNLIFEHVGKELNKIGLELINVNIRDISDESGFIEQLGKRAAAEAVQKALVEVAEKEKDGGIGVAEQDKDKHIGIKVNERTTAIELARLESEKIQGENLSKAAIAISDNDTLIQIAEANRKGQTAQKESDAKIDEAEFRAQAKAAIARAEQVEQEKRAEIEAPARAFKAEQIVKAQAEAESRRIQAEGEAAAIYAMKEAEARGEYEMLSKKADGLELLVKGCGGSKEAFQLLMLEHLDTLAETTAKAVSNIKFDKVVVWDSGTNKEGTNATSNFIRGLAGSLPPTMDIMKHVAGVDIPQYFGQLPGGKQGGSEQSATEAKGNPSNDPSTNEKYRGLGNSLVGLDQMDPK